MPVMAGVAWARGREHHHHLHPRRWAWEAVASLKMTIVTLDSGTMYKAWLADGYLGNAWAKLTPSGYFLVFRSGHLQDNNEVPRRALIFNSGRVHKLVPHGTQEEPERYFELPTIFVAARQQCEG